jgi:hypothetical protein
MQLGTNIFAESGDSISSQAADCSKTLVATQCHISESDIFTENHFSMKAQLQIKLYQQWLLSN